jgi:RNA polymerase sigma factor (sigma-70 family)
VEPRPDDLSSAADGPVGDLHADELLQTGDLLARFRAGERIAADELFVRYRPRLDAYLRARVPAGARPLGDTDDLVQDVCVKILGALDRFEMRGIGSFWWFARSIARNHLIDATRRRQALHETRLKEESEFAPAAKLRGPPAEAADHESAAAFDRALERVQDHVRRGLLMRLELGLDWSVIAGDCGFPSADAARVAIKRALASIAKEMAGHDEGA